MTIHVHEHCLKMARRDDGTPWWTAFPEPQSTPSRIEADEVLALLEDHEGRGSGLPRDFLLVDTRRTDCDGGTVTSSMNLPAHSFYPTRKILYDLCKQAGIKRVIFYCGEFHHSRHCTGVWPTNPRSALLGQANPTVGAHGALPGCRTMSTKLAAISSRR